MNRYWVASAACLLLACPRPIPTAPRAPAEPCATAAPAITPPARSGCIRVAELQREALATLVLDDMRARAWREETGRCVHLGFGAVGLVPMQSSIALSGENAEQTQASTSSTVDGVRMLTPVRAGAVWVDDDGRQFLSAALPLEVPAQFWASMRPEYLRDARPIVTVALGSEAIVARFDGHELPFQKPDFYAAFGAVDVQAIAATARVPRPESDSLVHQLRVHFSDLTSPIDLPY